MLNRRLDLMEILKVHACDNFSNPQNPVLVKYSLWLERRFTVVAGSCTDLSDQRNKMRQKHALKSCIIRLHLCMFHEYPHNSVRDWSNSDILEQYVNSPSDSASPARLIAGVETQELWKWLSRAFSIASTWDTSESGTNKPQFQVKHSP